MPFLSFRERHDTPSDEASTHNAVRVPPWQVDMRRDSRTGRVEVEDRLSRLRLVKGQSSHLHWQEVVEQRRKLPVQSLDMAWEGRWSRRRRSEQHDLVALTAHEVVGIG